MELTVLFQSLDRGNLAVLHFYRQGKTRENGQTIDQNGAGATLSDVSGLLTTEALIGCVYAGVAYGLFRLFEAEGRRRASLETY